MSWHYKTNIFTANIKYMNRSRCYEIMYHKRKQSVDISLRLANINTFREKKCKETLSIFSENNLITTF